MNRRRFLAGVGGLAAATWSTGFDWPFRTRAEARTLLIAGSTTMLPLTKLLAEGFMKRHPGILVAFSGGGSTPGLIAVKRGAIDIAALSRPLSRAEDDASTRAYLVAKDGIAVVVHPENPLRDLGVAPIRDAFEGIVGRWEDLGAGEGDIHLYHRAEGSTTRKGFEALVLDHADVSEAVRMVGEAADMAAAVAADPLGIGYLALKDVTPAVAVLAISGISMGRETVLSGRYPLSRPFYYATHGHQKEPTRLFLDYAQSAEGQALLERAEMIRVR